MAKYDTDDVKIGNIDDLTRAAKNERKYLPIYTKKWENVYFSIVSCYLVFVENPILLSIEKIVD